MTVRVWWELAKSGFRSQSRYRTAMLAALFTNTVFGLIRASLMLTAIEDGGGPIGGYDTQTAATYVWVGQALMAQLGVFGFWELATRVKSGDVAVDLLRPMHLFGQFYARDLGRAACDFFPRSLPILVVGALITGLTLPTTPQSYLLGAVSVLVASCSTFLGFFALNLLALWVVDVRGYMNLYLAVFHILSGFLIPVHWFPGWLQTIADATPFPSMVQTPIDMFIGVLSTGDALRALGIQVAWLAVLACVAVLMSRAGARQVVVQGG